MADGLLPFGEVQAIPARGLTEETCKKWGYTVGDRYGSTVQIANYRDDDAALVGQKARGKGKDFSVHGTIKDLLYGKWLWRSQGKRVFVCEGEIDALTVSQVLGNKWPVVSPPNGIQSARRTLAANIEWLNKFDNVTLCFDMDDPGRAAIEECVGLFPPGKVSIVTLPLKDPNEMLQAGRIEELIECLWGAKAYRPDGIKTVSDIRESVLQTIETGLSWFLESLNAMTYGRRLGECVGLGAGTGVGKTTFITQQIAHDLTLGESVGAFFFEQQPAETVRRVAGQFAKKCFHVPDGSWTQDELIHAVDDLEKRDAQLYLYDHFGACEWDVVKERIRYLAHSRGVRLFYIDHLTALAQGEENERTGLERITAEMGRLVKELNIWILFVSHLATPEGKPHEEGGRVMIRHFKGSRAIGFWSHFMFGLERNQQAGSLTARALTRLRCLKDRYTGRATGSTWALTYDTDTGILSETEDNDSPFSDETSNDGDNF